MQGGGYKAWRPTLLDSPVSAPASPADSAVSITTTPTPAAPLYTIRQTPNAGRAVFATRRIAANTLLCTASDLSITVLLRDYRKEVCAHCFFYDRGTTLPLRDPSTNLVFCSHLCQETWLAQAGDLGVQAWTAAERLSKGKSGEQRDEDYDMVDPGLPRPTTQEIAVAWETASSVAAQIRLARAGMSTKSTRKALAAVLREAVVPDVLAFCVSSILVAYQSPERWRRILDLVPDERPYHSFVDLVAFTRSYLQLLAVLPTELLPHATPETLITASSRDSHNSFGIRSLEDEGSEFFGYGCWPSASFFNHSCGPNVRKERIGREWRFVVDRGVEEGEELCISYLSGEERTMGVVGRGGRLRGTWGFVCACWRCIEGE
ncbi:SET domain-containing protein [Mytilinidion resinicola]|uniref:SET domain-containing protein n=1 Tax=Mytilinidion resinicola TaxID=574789 RepID=A0A6A6YWM9_9PEZI|nr:SET domain-containing protein [Mytilinidion resinicola]KAF2812929.1 SET domain-containing protein [Mytilinidion resinicola]